MQEQAYGGGIVDLEASFSREIPMSNSSSMVGKHGHGYGSSVAYEAYIKETSGERTVFGRDKNEQRVVVPFMRGVASRGKNSTGDLLSGDVTSTALQDVVTPIGGSSDALLGTMGAPVSAFGGLGASGGTFGAEGAWVSGAGTRGTSSPGEQQNILILSPCASD